MRRQLKYVNSINQELSFWSDDVVFNYGDLRSYSWSYSTDYDKIQNFKRTIVTKKFKARIYSSSREDVANNAYEIFEHDVQTESAGRLVIEGYYMKGYVTDITVTQDNSVIDLDITFATDSPFWIKETEYIFIDGTMTEGLDYPFDYPFDFTNSFNVSRLTNDGFSPCDFRIQIFGQCTNPVLYVADHAYKVNVELADGEYLTIDSDSKKIYLTQNDGTIVNEFANRNIQEYIFEKIPTGTSRVSWSSGIERFVITLIEKRSQPKWT